MGGNALKNTKTKRINELVTYNKIKLIIKNTLEENQYVIEEIKEVPNKNSFGDLDLLYYTSDKKELRQDITKLFNPNEIVHNGEVLSFDFQEFQIDLIKCISFEQMTLAKFYFSYGDLGSIIGTICTHCGLKFGHYGLFAILYENTIFPKNEFDPTKTIQSILLSNNPEHICLFLELDWKKYLKGFDNLIDIFEWIIQCKYFNMEIFTKINHAQSSRLNKRQMYINFIEYLGIKKDDITRKSIIKINVQSEAIEFFNKSDDIKMIKTQLETKKVVQSKFSGKYLAELGYNGKQIGLILNLLKIYINDNYQMEFDEWIYKTDQQSIYKVVDDIITNINLIGL